MAILVVLHAAAAVLLIVAGAAKIARPSSAAGLFESLGLPVRPVSGGLTPSATTAAALFGVVELGLGTVALAAASFAVAGQRTPTELMADQPAGGVGFVLAVGLAAGLFLALFTAVPKTLRSLRR